MAAGAVVNILLDIILIPRFSGLGCSVATLTAEVLANLLMWWKLKSIAYFETLPHLKKIIAAAVVMGIVAFGLDRLGVPVLVTVAASAAVYGGLLYVLKEPLLARVHPRFVAQ